jgi:RecB family exonuclease
MVAPLQLVPYGPDAIGALREAIGRAKGDDTLAPVTVAVPSNYAGLSLRRKLAAENERGLVNVRFYVLARIAELLGAPLLAAQGRKPLTSPVRAEAIRAVLAEDSGTLFRGVAEHAATERSLDLTFRDLRNAADDALDAIAARSERADTVVRLYRAFRTRTVAYYDEDELAEAAALAVSSGASAVRDVGHVIVHLPRRVSPRERVLLDALADTGGLSVVIGLTGDPDADAPARDLAEALSGRLGTADGTSPDEVATGTSIVTVTDAEEEIRAALRMIMERLAEGTPLHRMAVLYPLVQPYALLAHEQFSGAGVPHNGPAVRTLAQTISGKTLLGLLRLRETEFRRETVMDWLSAAPILEADGRYAPAHRFDTISRAAGVVKGREQWQQRLTRYMATLGEQREYALKKDEVRAGEIERIDADVERTQRLAGLLEELVKQVDTSKAATWAQFGAWAHALLDRYMGGEGRRADWPDEELQAHRTIEEILESLAGLDSVRPETNEATFRRALEREMERPAARVGRFGHGVFIGRIGDAMGTDFDVVIMIGMAEGALPPRARDDPLLPDRERAGGGEDVPLRSRRVAEERRSYLAALACAPERVLVYPRADLRGQRGKLPAPWLLETATRLEGKRVFSADLEKLTRDWYTLEPSFEAALEDGHEPGSEQEYGLRSLLRWPRAPGVTEHYLATHNTALHDGLMASKERGSPRMSRWDGIVGPAGELAPLAGKVVSPTALQDWATCPFRFYLGRILYVAETSTPEDTLSISAIERGNLLHEALERFLKEAPPRTSPTQPWSDEERAQLLTIGAELCDRAESRGLTGKPVLWQLARERIMRDLRGFVDADENMRAGYGVVNADVEMSFGMDGEPPIEVQTGGQKIGFRGRIDRIDRSPDGSRLVVIDYKSGGTYGYRDLAADVTQRGTALQLPVYALAAKQRFGDANTTAFYWFMNEQVNYETRGAAMTERAMVRFEHVTGTIADGIAEGVFPARPGARRESGFENCTFCAYDRACAGDRERAWNRKRTAAEVRAYAALAESDESPEDDA